LGLLDRLDPPIRLVQIELGLDLTLMEKAKRKWNASFQAYDHVICGRHAEFPDPVVFSLRAPASAAFELRAHEFAAALIFCRRAASAV
jgi:hypothetical protein